MSDFAVQLVFGLGLVGIGCVTLIVTHPSIWEQWDDAQSKAHPVRRYIARKLPTFEQRRASRRQMTRIIGVLVGVVGIAAVFQTLLSL